MKNIKGDSGKINLNYMMLVKEATEKKLETASHLANIQNE